MNKGSMKVQNCIHCGKCTKNCSFLSKYKLHIGNTEKLRELAYHCFLCGKCSEVCPVGIDGRSIILEMRQKAVEERKGKVPEKGYGMLLLEKKDYLFRNYKHINSGKDGETELAAADMSRETLKKKKSVFFPGCNFPSFYPETTKKITSLLAEHGIGVVYDCCGKPIAELGLKEQEERIAGGIERRLKETGVTEVIMACPNCYSFLKPRLNGILTVNIYEKLKELGIGKEIEGDISVFLPCPDRKEKEILAEIESFVTGDIHVITEVSCCGLGGCASGREPELAKGMAESLKKAGYGEIYTYCASCAGNLARNGYASRECGGNFCGKVTHVLAEILETQEKPDTSGSFLNRMKTKFY